MVVVVVAVVVVMTAMDVAAVMAEDEHARADRDGEKPEKETDSSADREFLSVLASSSVISSNGRFPANLASVHGLQSQSSWALRLSSLAASLDRPMQAEWNFVQQEPPHEKSSAPVGRLHTHRTTTHLLRPLKQAQHDKGYWRLLAFKSKKEM
uniref:Uncharacterized protein n=1 Tax=Anopheles atroparvus TaxID=41427 RepID=A0A182JIP7_ANOAO